MSEGDKEPDTNEKNEPGKITGFDTNQGEDVQASDKEVDPIEREISQELENVLLDEAGQSELGEEISVEDIIYNLNKQNKSIILEEGAIPDIAPIQALNSWNDLVDHISFKNQTIQLTDDEEEVENYAKEVLEKSGFSADIKGTLANPERIGYHQDEKSNNSRSVKTESLDDILSRNNEFNTVLGKGLLKTKQPNIKNYDNGGSQEISNISVKSSRSQIVSESPLQLDYNSSRGLSGVGSAANLSGASAKDLSIHSRNHSLSSLKMYRNKSKTYHDEGTGESKVHEEGKSKPNLNPQRLSEMALYESEFEGVDESLLSAPDSTSQPFLARQNYAPTSHNLPSTFEKENRSPIQHSTIESERKELAASGKPKVQFSDSVVQDAPRESLDKLDNASTAKTRPQTHTPKSGHTSESGKSSELLNRLEDDFDEDFFTDLYVDKPSKSAKTRGQVKKGFVKVLQKVNMPQSPDGIVKNLNLKGVKLAANLPSRSASPNKEDEVVEKIFSESKELENKRISIDITNNEQMFDEISFELKERLKEFEVKEQKEKEILKNIKKQNSDRDLSYKFTKSNKYQKDILQGDVSIPATIPVRPFSTLPLHSEEAERPRVSYRSFSDTEIEARPSKFEKKNLDIAQLEEAKFKVLNAIVNKLQTELDILKDKIKKQQDYQNSKNFQLESIKSSKSIKTKDLRELRLEMPLLQEKKRSLIQYLQEEFRIQFSKERLRNNQLLATAYEYRQKIIRRNAALEHHWEDNVALKDDVLKNLKGVQGLRDDVMVEVNKAQDDVDFLKATYEKLNTEVNFKRGEKKQMIKKRMVVDNTVQIKELELLEVALERRRANGGAVKSIKELDSVDLEDFNLTRLPVAQLDAKKVKYINVAKNQLMNLNALGAFSELEAIVSDFNQLKQVNFKDMAHLKALSVASNNLTTLEGLSSRLHYLNASANKLTTLKGLETAPNIRILILSSSKVKDMVSIKFLKNLLYLDISQSQLSEDIVMQLTSCHQLQCLEAGNNHFRVIPDIPNLAMNELHLTKNVLQQLNRMSWLFNLRVLNLYDNQISDISPLAMAPFLRELYLGHNVIKDVKNIYHIGICQNLEVLDLTGNPVMYDHAFPVAVGMLFPHIRLLNNMQINLHQHKTKRIYTLINVFEAIKFFNEVKTQLVYYIDDQKDDTADMMKTWKEFAVSRDKMIRNYMGPYFSPYLKYLTSNSVAAKFNPMSNLAAQERRLFWLSDAITDILKDSEIMPVPTSDGSIIYYLHHLDFLINNYRATHLQAIWRMKLQMRKFVLLRNKVLKIQRRLRDYFACIEPRRILRRLKKEKFEADAAIMIQKHWKRFRMRGKLEEMRIQHEKDLEEQAIKLVRPVPVSEQDLENAMMDKDIADINKWLEEEEDLKFDKKMKKYLENESLVHYPGMRKKKPPKKDRKGYRTSSKASSSHIVLDKIVVIRDDIDAELDEENFFDDEYDSEGRGDTSGSETGSSPPSPPTVDLHHTVQLAKERNDIMINLNRQFNKLVNTLPPTGHLTNDDIMKPQTPLKTTGRIGVPRLGEISFPQSPLKTAPGRTTESLLGETRRGESRLGKYGFPNEIQSTVGDAKTAVTPEALQNSNISNLKDRFENNVNPSILDATSFDSASRYTEGIKERDDIGWSQYGRKQPLINAMKSAPEKKIQPISIEEMLEPQTAPRDHKLIFEWDIHPGNVSQKLLAAERKESMPKESPIQYTGTGAFPLKGNYISTEPQFKPPVTLLINNYVASKILRPTISNIDPNTIHRLETKPRTKKGNYDTMLDLIPSQIVTPAYGSYQLPKPEPLPSISKKQ
ncbi:hypothetical protein HDV01_005914 [Terramyces sp. JEL0728]|nr:hypothetical protein HDV01_005914 [Terramyces sp. JEL0728]